MTDRTTKADVVVIGAGVAGIAAALTASEGGADVLVIDAATRVGGTAATAGGGVCIAGSPLQRELGIADDADLALEDWRSFGGPTADLDWAERYLRATAGELWDLMAVMGVRFHEVRWNEGNRVPRWHAPVGGGKAVMAAFESHARKVPNIRWSLGTRAAGLIVEGGAVRGIRTIPVDAPESAEQDVRAGAVVLATGGFANDPELVRQHATAAASAPRVLLGGGPGARGQGHRMLTDIRAATSNLDAVWMYPYGLPDHRPTSEGRGLVVRGLLGEIWVNREGLRFHDETRRGGASGTPALLAQDGATCWSVIDARIAAQMTVADPRYRSGDVPDRPAIDELLDGSPWITTADDLNTLGERAGIDSAALRTTVEQHNAHCGTDAVDEFGRDLSRLLPLVAPPFRALQFFPLARKNLGGIRTDAATRVLDERGSIIEGLHAVGELAGMAGGSINGRAALEGTMFGPSLYSGLVAGRALR